VFATAADTLLASLTRVVRGASTTRHRYIATRDVIW
jgi:hypothetical protein